MVKIPSPRDLGMPEKFNDWRIGQWGAIENGVTCVSRVDAHSVPTGGGKTLTYIAQSALAGKRTAIVTSTKGLQKQILDDFKDTIPICNITGKGNYPCSHKPGWSCADGHASTCPLKGSSSCAYSKVYFKALSSKFVLTNYSFWSAVHKYGLGLGTFDRLVLDEAHSAFDELSSTVQIRLSVHEIEEMLKISWPKKVEDLATWKVWASAARVVADKIAKDLKARIFSGKEVRHQWIKDFQHLRNLIRKLGTLACIRPTDWVIDQWEYGFMFDAIKPSRYAESTLFMKIPKVSLFSATLRPQTLRMIGIFDDFDFWDYPSNFDSEGSKVMHIPTCYVDHNMSSQDMARWLMRADQIIQRRLDRRGAFHTTSYARRDVVLEKSDYSRYMITNRKGDITADVVERFRNTPPPVVLVSPSITTGYDLLYDQCRYQILGKVPWPDGRSKLMKARQQFDPRYAQYVAMQALVQACGRPRRAEDDWAESFIPDDHFVKFVERNHDLAPRWFLNCIRWESNIPAPPPLH